MGEKADEMKGRVKEAAGNLSDNRDLEREGKADRMGADAKGKVADAKDRIEDAIDSVKDKVTRALDDR